MTRMPATEYALTLIADGHTPKQAADQAGLEPGEVVRALVLAYRATAHDHTCSAPGDLTPYTGHPSARVRQAAARLAAAYEADQGRAALLAEKSRLEQELAKVKAELRGGRCPSLSPSAAPVLDRCDDCGWEGRRLAMHRARAHQEPAA